MAGLPIVRIKILHIAAIHNINQSTHREQTPPMPKSDPGFKSGFPD